MDMQFIPWRQTNLDVPPSVAVCPKCGGKLTVEIDAWQQEDDGTWTAESPHTTCEHEPDIDSKKWREWHNWHYNMPYVDWMPIDNDVEKWLVSKYRFTGLDRQKGQHHEHGHS